MPTRAVINAVLAGGISTAGTAMRSEERRVGKEGRSRGAPDHLKKKKSSIRVNLNIAAKNARQRSESGWEVTRVAEWCDWICMSTLTRETRNRFPSQTQERTSGCG